jgi:aldehyde dehydrogenase (NAD+)
MRMTTATPVQLLPEVQAFLSQSPLGGFVDGRDTLSSDGGTLTTRDPGSGERLAEVADMTAGDVAGAVEAAAAAFHRSGWATMPQNERSAALHRLADLVERHKPILAQIEALDAGKVLDQAAGDVQNCADTLRYFADMAQHVEHRVALAVKGHEAWRRRLPWGPCGFIFPWNFPIVLVGWSVSPALAAGNTVVIKPAEDTPLSTLYFARLAQEAGIPDGVVNVVTGLGETAGAALAKEPRLKHMSFTGSPEVGRLVAQACGGNLVPVKLELGGKGAAVVFDDVDIEQTAQKLVGAITFHAGQVCCDATRWIVQRDIYDDFVHRCVEKLQKVRIGHPLEAQTQMGPVVSRKQQARVLGYLEKGTRGGAKLLLEGGEAEVPGRAGYYVKPALLAGSPDNVAAREEIFGPVAYVMPFVDERDAIAKANATDYGLANSVWSTDLVTAARVAEQLCAGNSWINAHNLFPHGVPYGGINKSGMGGGVLSIETLLGYWRHLSVVRPL